MGRELVGRTNVWRGRKVELDLEFFEKDNIAIDTTTGTWYQASARGVGSVVLTEISGLPAAQNEGEVLFDLHPAGTNPASEAHEDDLHYLSFPNAATAAAVGSFRLPSDIMSFTPTDLVQVRFFPFCIATGTVSTAIDFNYRLRSISFTQLTNKTADLTSGFDTVMSGTKNVAKLFMGSEGLMFDPTLLGSEGSNALVTVHIERLGASDAYDGHIGLAKQASFKYKKKAA